MIYKRRNSFLFSKTFYSLLCFSRSDPNSMFFLVFLNKLTHLFLCLLFVFFVTYGAVFKKSFSLPSFDLTITSNLISVFMKGAGWSHTNLLFNKAIVFKTDKQVSLKCFRYFSLICKFEFLSLFSTWSLKRGLQI